MAAHGCMRVGDDLTGRHVPFKRGRAGSAVQIAALQPWELILEGGGEGVRGYTRRGASVAALSVVCVGEGGRSEAPCPY